MVLTTGSGGGDVDVDWLGVVVVLLAIGGGVGLYPLNIHEFFLRILTDRQLVVNRKHP